MVIMVITYHADCDIMLSTIYFWVVLKIAWLI